MKTILLPFHNDAIDLAAFDLAILLAEQFHSYLEGLFVWQPPQIIAGAGEGITLYGDYVSQIASEGQQLAVQARAQFEQLIRERGIALQANTAAGGATTASAPTAGWFEGEGLEDRVIGDYGRVFDIIVIGRSSRANGDDWQTTCEAALFESGRPILLAPPQAPTTFGRRVLIAWNGSTETARTIALGMPLLTRADSVVVLSVEGGTVPGPSGEQVTGQLQHHGINARALSVEGQLVGETILQQCAEHDIDLLFKGAYTQGRLRQLIFGGATRHIISNAGLPVLMAH